MRHPGAEPLLVHAWCVFRGFGTIPYNITVLVLFYMVGSIHQDYVGP